MEKTEIKSSKIKIYLTILGCILASFLCLQFYLRPDEFVSRIFRSKLFIETTGLVGAVFFGFGFFWLLKIVIKRKIGLTIDKYGINDNSGAMSVGLIDWEDIKEVRKINVMSTKFLLIDVYNNDKYLAKSNSLLKSKLMEYNIKIYGTPISISSNTLNCNFDELEMLIRTELEQYKKDESHKGD